MLFKSLESKIGKERRTLLLDKALVVCEQGYRDLSVQLKYEDWDKSALCAHSLKGNISIFSCQNLIVYLEMVENKEIEVIEQPSFQKQLETEYKHCLESIKQLHIS